MGPDESLPMLSGEFTDKIPPSFDGRNNYAAYRDDILLWTKLTTISPERQGPVLVGRLYGEAKVSARTLSIDEICRPDGVEKLIEHLDRSYGIDEANQLDIDLASFLEFCWKKEVTVDQYVAGFHSRLDKIASLELDEKLKGHFLLRQANLAQHERNLVVGASSVSYDVKDLSNSLRNAFRHE